MNINSEELIELIDDLYSEYVNEENLAPLAAVDAVITEIGNYLVGSRYNQAIAISLFMLKIEKEDYKGDEIKKARHLEGLKKDLQVIYKNLTSDEKAKHKELLNLYLDNPNQVEVTEILKFGY